jgi:phosphate-selective porin
LRAVRVPLQITFWFATATLGVAVTAMVKSGIAATTVRPKVWVFGAGAPDVVAEMVTIFGPPMAAPTAAATVSVKVTGADEVGLAEFDGEKIQVLPVGRPEEQFRETVPSKLPAAVT